MSYLILGVKLFDFQSEIFNFRFNFLIGLPSGAAVVRRYGDVDGVRAGVSRRQIEDEQRVDVRIVERCELGTQRKRTASTPALHLSVHASRQFEYPRTKHAYIHQEKHISGNFPNDIRDFQILICSFPLEVGFTNTT